MILLTYIINIMKKIVVYVSF